MSYYKQRIRSIYFEKLKSLKDVGIDFDKHNVTAIMGPNRCGKTTILHALACCYQNLDGTDDITNTPRYYFRTTPNSSFWLGSRFTVTHTYNKLPDIEMTVQAQERMKDNVEAGVRWRMPPLESFNKRVKRNTVYIKIRDSVPELEMLTSNGPIAYDSEVQEDDKSARILKSANHVLNESYSEFSDCKYNSRDRRMHGVQVEDLKYSANYMSAGEQRVFQILKELYSAPQFSLFLIDEISLFLHQDALERLIEVMVNVANEENKNYQIVFTSHFPATSKVYKNISVYYLVKTSDKTLLFTGYHPDAIYSLTGETKRSVEIYVEDDVSEAIVSQITDDMSFTKHVRFIRYGSSSNGYTLAAAYTFKPKIGSTIIVGDGDRHGDNKEKLMKRFLSGDNPHDKKRREKAFSIMIDLNTTYLATPRSNPEYALWQLIKTLGLEKVEPSEQEIYSAAMGVMCTMNDHDYVTEIIDRVGKRKETMLQQIVKLASKADGWDNYVYDVKKRLERFKKRLNSPHERNRMASEMHETILEYVIEEYAEEDDEVTFDTALISSGLVDSFSMVSLKVFLEKKYDIKLPDDEATPEAFDTVNSIVELVKKFK